MGCDFNFYSILTLFGGKPAAKTGVIFHRACRSPPAPVPAVSDQRGGLVCVNRHAAQAQGIRKMRGCCPTALRWAMDFGDCSTDGCGQCVVCRSLGGKGLRASRSRADGKSPSSEASSVAEDSASAGLWRLGECRRCCLLGNRFCRLAVDYSKVVSHACRLIPAVRHCRDGNAGGFSAESLWYQYATQQ